MPYLDRRDVQYHYLTSAEGANAEKPALLCLAGLASDSRSWQPVVSSLSQHFHLIMPDNRYTGRTRTETTVLDLSMMVEDALALLDHLGRSEPVNVLGHSMGGMMATAMAAHYPDRVHHLILAATGTHLAGGMSWLWRDMAALRHLADRGDLALEHWFRLLFQWMFTPAFFDDERKVIAAAQLAAAMPDGQSASDFERQVTLLLEIDIRAHIAEVRCPTLLIDAENDRLFAGICEHNALRDIKNSRMVTLPNAGHSLHWDQPVAFAETVLQFLQR